MSAKPVIGISCFVEATTRGDWVNQLSIVLPVTYARHVERAGGIAVVLPPPQEQGAASVSSAAAEVLSVLDGLVIAGGADVESTRYHAEPDRTAQAPRRDRDEWELALARESRERSVPTLGICRGMQIMAVEAGGTLEQHIPDRTATAVHSSVRGHYAYHPVQPVPESRLASILGDERRDVPTYHHQAVASHPGLEPCAWHADGTLEAMEDRDQPFRLAVQWHPEAGEDNRLFAALVQAAGFRAP